MPFFVELSVDEYGNRGHAHVCVIEATVGQHPIVGEQLRIITPPEIADIWPTVHKKDWIEVEGPARVVTKEERDRLILEATQK